jgi:hypothetical protein
VQQQGAGIPWNLAESGIVIMTLKVPVMLSLFRQRCALDVLQAIRGYAPERLFLAADGGRTADEHAQRHAVRRAVEAAIDWPCLVDRLYSDRNLGTRGNIPRGISWAFHPRASSLPTRVGSAVRNEQEGRRAGRRASRKTSGWARTSIKPI